MDEKTQSQVQATSTPVLTIERIFNTSAERLWQAWTEPERVKRWWGPKGFTCPVCEIDLRVGGVAFSCMRSPEGQDMMWSGGVFREIIPTSRLVFTDMFTDPEGNLIPASQYGMTDWPDVLLVTLTFSEPEPGKTLLTLRHEGMPEGQNRDLTSEGWRQSFDKLAKLVQE